MKCTYDMTSVCFVTCFICFCFATSAFGQISGLALNADESLFSLIRNSRATQKCVNGFRCVSTGKCIEAEKRCNGIVDCADGSDEFSDCSVAVSCPGYLFTCNYGACIETDKVCDGKYDCRDNSDEANCPNKPTGDKISSNCKSNQFECRSGQCIARDNKCNGVADCSDKSDEIQETCLNMYCPGFTFKCDYGACVDGYAPCNGISECIDNSDEKNCQTPAPNKTTSKPPVKPPPVVVSPTSPGCILPDHPENGKWTIAGGASAQPQSKVVVNTLITFACNQQYKLSSEVKLLACLDEGWSAQPPSCRKLCPPLYTTEITHVTCYDENKVVIKCGEATDGANAKFECAAYYEPADRVTALRFCYDGSWNLPPPQCIPVCGEKRVSAEPLIVNGQNVEKGDYPWVTALFQRVGGQFMNVCGGSMLTQRVIITAAHCVTDDDGNLINIDNVRVAVGKYYNKYKDPKDTQAQYSPIQKILVHPKYKGANQRYASDIAFLVTKDVLLLSKVVQPVCYHNINNIHLTTKNEGVITGWGFTEAGGNPSDELKEVAIPYKDDATCATELPPEWMDKYFTYDKFCAGHYNKSIAVCKGDSGGGLVFLNTRDGRYYIHGLVSIGRKVTEGCDIQLSSLLTKVAVHADWLEQVTAQYNVI